MDVLPRCPSFFPFVSHLKLEKNDFQSHYRYLPFRLVSFSMSMLALVSVSVESTVYHHMMGQDKLIIRSWIIKTNGSLTSGSFIFIPQKSPDVSEIFGKLFVGQRS